MKPHAISLAILLLCTYISQDAHTILHNVKAFGALEQQVKAAAKPCQSQISTGTGPFRQSVR